MYINDIPQITRHVLTHQRGLIDAVDFVLATIQQHFSTIPQILGEWMHYESELAICVNPRDAEKPGTLWGMKELGFQHIREHHDRLAALVRHGAKTGDAVEVIDTLIEIPGLNTVKAAFVAQLCGLDVGCIDTHNAAIYDVDVASFAVNASTSARTRIAKIEAYVALCRELGGAEYLWDTWCEFIAIKYHGHYRDAEHVSAQHVHCIVR